jgi:rhamnogalacturonan endolyase
MPNTAARNQLGIAYLDGKTPFLIAERGTYQTIKLTAYMLSGNALREVWRWDSHDEGNAPLLPLLPPKALSGVSDIWNWNNREGGVRYYGQGAHVFHAADVDGDGRDEVIYGAAVVDDNGQGLWSAALGHVDHVSVGQMDPTRPGLQIQYGCEYGRKKGGLCQVDAKTGAVLWELDEPTGHVHGSGLSADIDPSHPGAECYGKDIEMDHSPNPNQWLLSAQGDLISTADLGGVSPHAAYWDGDTQRELLRDGRLTNFASGQQYEPQIEGQPLLIADLLGDWREEIVTALPGELRIYTTALPAHDRRICLLRDPIYRTDVCEASSGYYNLPQFQVLPGFEAR